MKAYLTFSDDVAEALFSAIEMVEKLTKTSITVDLYPDPVEGAATRGPAAPRVQYRAIGDASALRGLGETTLEGIVFAHLLTSGPCTERQIRDSKALKKKAVESSLMRLRRTGVVISEPITTVAVEPPASSAASDPID